jgi:hypothetical protein
MKIRIIMFLAISAIVTLSFTVVSVKETPASKPSAQELPSAPIGGLIVEDKI